MNGHFFLIKICYKRDYLNKMAEEINELLQERESVSLSELTNFYELPADFIHQVSITLFFFNQILD